MQNKSAGNATAPAINPSPAVLRIKSLDAYRGFIMLLMMGEILSFHRVSEAVPGSDRWFLNLFPREKPFEYNGGGYSTLSFIPTLGTMILGLLAGNILKSVNASSYKVKRFVVTGSFIGFGNYNSFYWY